MSVNRYARVSVSALIYFAWSCGGGDSTTEPPKQPTLTLTSDLTSVTQPTTIILVAKVNGGAVAARRVVFYEKTVGSPEASQPLHVDSVPPFVMERELVSLFDNGTKEYNAVAYEGSTQIATSNTISVVINLPDNLPLDAKFFYSGPRITTPGAIRFRVAPNKPITRIEVFNGTKKVAEDLAPAPPFIVRVPVTAADNGTQGHVVKAYDATGASVQTGTIWVVVDIKWNLVQNVDGGAEFLATDATNALYLAGTTRGYDLSLAKYDADGRQLWARTFGGPDQELARSLSLDGSGRVYLTGLHIPLAQFSDQQCFVNVYDPGGLLLASKPITTPTMDHTSGCIGAVDGSGSLYVIVAGIAGLFILKHDPEGNLLWSRDIRGTVIQGSQYQINDLTGILVDALSGGVYFAGQGNTGAPSGGNQGLFLVKLDTNGNRVWGSHYGTAGVFTSPHYSHPLVADPNGGVYIVGNTQRPDNEFTQFDAFVASHAADGTQRWIKTLDGGSFDLAVAAAADTRGVYLVGVTYGEISTGHVISESSQGGADLFVARYSAVGDLLGIRLLGTPNYDGGSGIVIGATGDVYVAGGTAQPETPATAFLARYRDAP